MNWKKTWNTIAETHANPEEQVGRVVSGNLPEGKNLPEVTASHIATLLKLAPADKLLDVCCGNGLLTFNLSKICASVTGTDFSPAMIQLAKQHHAAPNIQYHIADATILPPSPEGPFDKICLNYSFQYFESYADGRNVIKVLVNQLKPGGLLLLGEVPDFKKRNNFYRTWLSKAYLVYHTLIGKNQMGKFWKEQELNQICTELGLKGSVREQPPGFPYAHYRFDYLIEKPVNSLR